MGPQLLFRILNETWGFSGPAQTPPLPPCGLTSSFRLLWILIKKVRTLALFIFFSVHLTVISPVPIYDACSSPFLFSKEDFVSLPSLPRFKRHGDPKLADLPPNALVTVFFTLNTYSSTRAPPTPSTHKMSARSESRDDKAPVASGSSHSPAKGSSAQSHNVSKLGSSLVLSLNLQFLLHHGQIPDDD